MHFVYSTSIIKTADNTYKGCSYLFSLLSSALCSLTALGSSLPVCSALHMSACVICSVKWERAHGHESQLISPCILQPQKRRWLWRKRIIDLFNILFYDLGSTFCINVEFLKLCAVSSWKKWHNWKYLNESWFGTSHFVTTSNKLKHVSSMQRSQKCDVQYLSLCSLIWK